MLGHGEEYELIVFWLTELQQREIADAFHVSNIVNIELLKAHL